MQVLHYLMLIFSSVVFMNGIISFVMLRKSGLELYSLLFKYWLTLTLFYVLFGIVSPTTPFLGGLIFSTGIISYWFIACVVARITDEKLELRKFIIIWVACISLSTLAWLSNLHSFFILLPCSIAGISPGSYISIKVLQNSWKRQSFFTKGLVISILLQSMHALDFAILFPIQESKEIGFTIGFILLIAHTLFSFGAILSSIFDEKLELEQVLITKARTSHKARLASIRSMAGGVAHEINNPLQAIKVSTGLLKKSGTETTLDNFQSKLERINAAVDRIAAITSGLIEFSNANKSRPLDIVNLNDMIHSTLLVCRESFELSGITLEIDVPPDLKAPGVEAEIKQVIHLLLQNAQEALEATNDRKIIIVGYEKNGLNRLEISNTGPLISNVDSKKIFEPFFTTKDGVRKSGLGLSVAKGIIESYSGNLTHGQNENRTTFSIDLPIA